MTYTDKQQNNSTICSCNNFSHLPLREAVILRIHYQNPFDSSPEIWKAIPGHEEYWISNKGLIKHLKSYGGKPRVLVPTVRNNKYFYITLSVNGRRKGFAVDRLVAVTFFEIPIHEIRKVIHKDGQKLNNTFSNLASIKKEIF